MNRFDKLKELLLFAGKKQGVKKQRKLFDDRLIIISLHLCNLIQNKEHRKSVDFFLQQLDKSFSINIGKFGYRFKGLPSISNTMSAVETLTYAFFICNIRPNNIKSYKVYGKELPLLTHLSERVKEIDSEGVITVKRKLSTPFSRQKMTHLKFSYAPTAEEILSEIGLDYNSIHLKMKSKPSHKKSASDFKEAFVRPHPYNNIITFSPILVNPSQKKIADVSDRRWRTFSLNDGFIAKCCSCGAIITSGLKSLDDYICSDCRYKRYSKCSLWTVKKR